MKYVCVYNDCVPIYKRVNLRLIRLLNCYVGL